MSVLLLLPSFGVLFRKSLPACTLKFLLTALQCQGSQPLGGDFDCVRGRSTVTLYVFMSRSPGALLKRLPFLQLYFGPFCGKSDGCGVWACSWVLCGNLGVHSVTVQSLPLWLSSSCCDAPASAFSTQGARAILALLCFRVSCAVGFLWGSRW